MSQKAITIVLGLLVIATFVWYLGGRYLGSKNQNTKIMKETSSSDISPKLYFLTSDNYKNIWQTDSAKNLKKIYTDADEDEKIVAISNVATEVGKLWAVVSRDENPESGKLVAINLLDSTKQVLQNTISVPTICALSQDGKNFAYIIEVNDNVKTRYDLMFQALGEELPQKITEFPSSPKGLSWTGAGQLFIIQSSQNGDELIRIDVQGKRTKSIKKFNKQAIEWVAPSETSDLLVSIRDYNDTVKGKIAIIGTDGSIIETLLKYQGGIARFAYLTQGDKWLAYVIAQYDSQKDQVKINNQTDGQIYIENLLNKAATPIQKGVQVLGWSE